MRTLHGQLRRRTTPAQPRNSSSQAWKSAEPALRVPISTPRHPRWSGYWETRMGPGAPRCARGQRPSRGRRWAQESLAFRRPARKEDHSAWQLLSDRRQQGVYLSCFLGSVIRHQDRLRNSAELSTAYSLALQANHGSLLLRTDKDDPSLSYLPLLASSTHARPLGRRREVRLEESIVLPNQRWTPL